MDSRPQEWEREDAQSLAGLGQATKVVVVMLARRVAEDVVLLAAEWKPLGRRVAVLDADGAIDDGSEMIMLKCEVMNQLRSGAAATRLLDSPEDLWRH